MRLNLSWLPWHTGTYAYGCPVPQQPPEPDWPPCMPPFTHPVITDDTKDKRIAALESVIREVLARTRAGYFTRRLRVMLEDVLGEQHG